MAATSNKKRASLVQISETILCESSQRIDKENGIIHGVRVIGRVSRNGREYSDKAIAEAISLYEGTDVNLNHRGKGDMNGQRPIQESWGVLRNVSQDAKGAVSELHYLKEHRDTNAILERIERFPERFGLSHDAMGQTSTKGGKVIVESLKKVHSVDLVRNPATTNTLFESEENIVTKTVKEILESAAEHKETDLFKLLEMMGQGDAPMAPADMPVEAAEDADPMEAVKSSLKQAYMAAAEKAFDTPGKTISILKDLAGEVMKIADKLNGAPKADAGDDSTKEKDMEPKLAESLAALTESIAESKLISRRIEILQEHQIDRARLTPAKREELDSKKTEAEIRTFCESLTPAEKGAKKPSLPTRLTESTAYTVPPASSQEYARRLR